MKKTSWIGNLLLASVVLASSCTREQRQDNRKGDGSNEGVSPDGPTTAPDTKNDKDAKKDLPPTSDQLFLFETGVRCVVFNQAGLTLECNGWNPSGRYLTKAVGFASGVTVTWEGATWMDASDKSIGEFNCFDRGTAALTITCGLSGMPANAKTLKIKAKVWGSSTTDQTKKSRDEEVLVSLDRTLPRPARP